MSMEISGMGGVLSGGMMLQKDKFATPSKSLPDVVPLSQIGTPVQLQQAGSSGMLPEVPTLRDIKIDNAPRNVIDIRA